MDHSPKPADLSDDVLLDQIEAGKLLSIPAATLQKWRSTGEVNLPWIRVGRGIRYRTVDLRAWIEANTHNKPGVKA